MTCTEDRKCFLEPKMDFINSETLTPFGKAASAKIIKRKYQKGGKAKTRSITSTTTEVTPLSDVPVKTKKRKTTKKKPACVTKKKSSKKKPVKRPAKKSKPKQKPKSKGKAKPKKSTKKRC